METSTQERIAQLKQQERILRLRYALTASIADEMALVQVVAEISQLTSNDRSQDPPWSDLKG